MDVAHRARRLLPRLRGASDARPSRARGFSLRTRLVRAGTLLDDELHCGLRRLPWAVAALALFVLGAVLSLFPAFACWIAKKIGGGRLATELPALAGVWTLAEWLRGDALANFGWLMPGYAVIDTPLAGWAPLGGIYAVTLAQLLFAALVAVALSCRLAWLAVPVIGAALIAGTGQVSRQHAWSEPSSTVDVRIIQPALPWSTPMRAPIPHSASRRSFPPPSSRGPHPTGPDCC